MNVDTCDGIFRQPDSIIIGKPPSVVQWDKDGLLWLLFLYLKVKHLNLHT